MRLPTLAALTLLLALVGSCRAAGPEDGPVTITVDPAVRHQTIMGWGTCLFGYLPALEKLYRTDAFADFYARDLGCNMLRINLYPAGQPPRRTADEIRYQDYSFDGEGHRLRVYLDFAKKLRERNPEAVLVGTVWSPPVWMKRNNALVDKASDAINADSYAFKEGPRLMDNRLDMDKLPLFTKWVVEMVKLFDAEGVPLSAVSVANEPQFTQWFESCVWTADDWAKATQSVGAALEAAGYGGVKLYGPETMTGFNWANANPMYVKAAGEQLDVFATHGYSDGFNADNSAKSSWDFWNLVKDQGRPYWVTEGGTGGHDWPKPVNGMAMCLHNALVYGNASAVMPWQVTAQNADDGSLMGMDTPTAKTHVARQYFHYVRPGAVRVDATPTDSPGGVRASAFVHDADGTLTVVLVNTGGGPRDVTLKLPAGVAAFGTAVRTSAAERSAALPAVAVADGSAVLTLPAQSVTTLQGTMK